MLVKKRKQDAKYKSTTTLSFENMGVWQAPVTDSSSPREASREQAAKQVAIPSRARDSLCRTWNTRLLFWHPSCNYLRAVTLHTIILNLGGTIYNNHTLETLRNQVLIPRQLRDLLLSFIYILSGIEGLMSSGSVTDVTGTLFRMKYTLCWTVRMNI